MKFVHPEFLWGFLLLVIPVIIHLFNFKKYKTLYFSSLQFIKHVDQQTKSTQKLRHYLILASRLFAFAFLILAFAQPYFSDAEDFDKEKEQVVMLYLDNSFSMEANGPEGQLISQAREKAKEIINNAGVNTLFLIGTNEMSGIEDRALNKAEAIERIDNIELSSLHRTISDIVNWQVEAYRKNFSELNNTQYILMSDFQRQEMDPKKIESIKELNFYPVQLIPEKKSNVYIDSVWFSSPVHKENTNSEINIRIQNSSNQNIENIELMVKIEELDKTIFTSVDANSQSTTTFTYREKKSGWKNGVITIADNNLYFDDSYFISYEVHNSASVLLINGEDQVNNFAIVYSLDDYYKVNEKSLNSIILEDFKNKDIVILNGVNSISTGLTDYLVKYKSTGGTVALFPGTNAAKNDWNRLLNKLDLAPLGQVISSGNRIDELAYEDPFFNGVFDRKPEKLNLPSVSKSYQSVQNKGIPLISLKNGLPLLSYSQNNGYSFCFYSSVNERFGNFANDALFSTILLRIGELSKRTQPLSLIIGESSKYPIYSKGNSELPLKITSENFEVIPEMNEVGGVTYIGINQIGSGSLKAGNYSIIQGDRKLANISLNYSRKESKTNYLEQNEIISLFGGELNEIKLNKISSAHQFSTIDLDKPFSYWKICIVLTLIFVITEMLIVRFFK